MTDRYESRNEDPQKGLLFRSQTAIDVAMSALTQAEVPPICGKFAS